MKSILIADDHLDTVEVMQGFLATLGFDAAVANDGVEAIEVAKRVRPASILLDIRLPVIDGFEVARILRQSKEFAETSIIGCSGYVGLEFYVKAREVGIDFYLPKPIEPEVLAACLEPEKYPDFMAGNIVDLSRDLLERSIELQAKAQALSVKSIEALKRAQEVVRVNFNARRNKW